MVWYQFLDVAVDIFDKMYDKDIGQNTPKQIVDSFVSFFSGNTTICLLDTAGGLNHQIDQTISDFSFTI